MTMTVQEYWNRKQKRAKRVCRLLGHKPVIGGGWERRQPWQMCKRCQTWLGYVRRDQP